MGRVCVMTRLGPSAWCGRSLVLSTMPAPLPRCTVASIPPTYVSPTTVAPWPPRSDGASGWVRLAMGRGRIVPSAVLVLLVGVAETAWLLDGTGLTLLVKFTHRVFGFH